jgi:hypothetical protein
MVGPFELVLDDQHALMREISADQVELETADGVLAVGELELDPERVSEMVLVGQEPRCEHVRFVLPDLAGYDRGKTAELRKVEHRRKVGEDEAEPQADGARKARRGALRLPQRQDG